MDDIETTTHVMAGALIDGAMPIGRDPADASLCRRVEVTTLRFVQRPRWSWRQEMISQQEAAAPLQGAAPPGGL